MAHPVTLPADPARPRLGAIASSRPLILSSVTLCYQKMSSARMSRGETLVLVMQPAQDRSTHDLALAPGR